jgi:tRNA A37 threonylcarbamoyladenosine synthetase subunit TsaC/SUA5/YrdC
MDRVFGPRVGMIYDDGDAPPAAPSTLVDASVRPSRILRQGSLVIPPEDLV